MMVSLMEKMHKMCAQQSFRDKSLFAVIYLKFISLMTNEA